MMATIRSFTDSIARRWCKIAHADPMWPVGGKYRCPDCQRVYSVSWEAKPVSKRRKQSASGRQLPRAPLTILETINEIALS